MEATKEELRAAKKALRKEMREELRATKKAEKLSARESFKEAVLAKVEQLKNK